MSPAKNDFSSDAAIATETGRNSANDGVGRALC
jgi:hypothetical protein